MKLIILASSLGDVLQHTHMAIFIGYVALAFLQQDACREHYVWIPITRSLTGALDQDSYAWFPVSNPVSQPLNGYPYTAIPTAATRATVTLNTTVMQLTTAAPIQLLSGVVWTSVVELLQHKEPSYEQMASELVEQLQYGVGCFGSTCSVVYRLLKIPLRSFNETVGCQ